MHLSGHWLRVGVVCEFKALPTLPVWQPAVIQAVTPINLGNLMKIVGSHCQRELEVQLLHATQHWPRQSANGLAPPNGSSTRLRFCWLTSYPQWRIVRPSMAES